MASPEAVEVAKQMRAWQAEFVGSTDTPSLSDQRKASGAFATFGLQSPGVDVSETIAGNRRALVYARSAGGSTGVVLYLHGGGLIVGSPETHSNITGRLASESGFTVYSIDYRLAPENPYPAALDDARSALDWIIAQGTEPQNVYLGGDSAGGALALVTLLDLLSEGGPNLGGAFLFSPWLDFTLGSGTIATNAQSDLMASLSALEQCRVAYSPDRDYANHRISPLLSTNLSSLPRLLVHASDEEVLLGDALSLAERVRRDGGSVELRTWPVVQHVFQFSVGKLPEADESLADVARWLQNAPPSSTSE